LAAEFIKIVNMDSYKRKEESFLKIIFKMLQKGENVKDTFDRRFPFPLFQSL